MVFRDHVLVERFLMFSYNIGSYNFVFKFQLSPFYFFSYKVVIA
jgi:hypothetical protein